MEIAAGWTGVAGQMRTATEEAGVQISVIIPAFNRADLIEATLATVYAQTLPGVEVVVVDDGSTDETAAILRRHAARVRYVHQENSGGCSRGRNVGIRESRGRYIAIFDSDDLMAPAKLEKQVAFLERHPAVDFVFTDFVNFEDDREDPPHTHGCPRFREALRHCRVEEDGYILPQAQAYELLLTENYIGASGMVFRRSLAERSGDWAPPPDPHAGSVRPHGKSVRVEDQSIPEREAPNSAGVPWDRPWMPCGCLLWAGLVSARSGAGPGSDRPLSARHRPAAREAALVRQLGTVSVPHPQGAPPCGGALEWRARIPPRAHGLPGCSVVTGVGGVSPSS
jgi:hypothetical protein